MTTVDIVQLERDGSDRDPYGRLLRYVWLERSEGRQVHLNELSVAEGTPCGLARCWRS